MYYIYFNSHNRYEYGFAKRSTAVMFANIHGIENYIIKKN